MVGVVIPKLCSSSAVVYSEDVVIPGEACCSACFFIPDNKCIFDAIPSTDIYYAGNGQRAVTR